MFHTNNPVIKHKSGLLNLAEELRNVSRACKIMGVSCDTFYRYRELADEGGVDALINRSRRTPNLKLRKQGELHLLVVNRFHPAQYQGILCAHEKHQVFPSKGIRLPFTSCAVCLQDSMRSR